MNLIQDTNGESWVVITYHNDEPSEVYGAFLSRGDAIEWAQRQAKGVMWGIKMILNPNEE